MDGYQRLIIKASKVVDELYPWDLDEAIKTDKHLILLDIREQYEFEMMHITNSINVPRGVLEGACCWGYDDTLPILASSRNQAIIVICRSGNRSILAAQTMQQLGFSNTRSLKLGIKGWNDHDLPLLSKNHPITPDQADKWLTQPISPTKLNPK